MHQWKYRHPYLIGQVLQTCCRSLRRHRWPRWPPAVERRSWSDIPSHPLHTPRAECNLEGAVRDEVSQLFSLNDHSSEYRISFFLTWYVQVAKAVSCSASDDVASPSSTLDIPDTTSCPCGGTAERCYTCRLG